MTRTPPQESPPNKLESSSERKFVEVALAIVFERSAGKLLICKRKADSVLGGYWEFPGGKCNTGETPRDCAIRETEEETGLQVKVLCELPVIEHEYPHARVRLHPFVCEGVGGQLELRAVAEALWIAPENVVNYRFPEANQDLLKAVAGGLAPLLTSAAK